MLRKVTKISMFLVLLLAVSATNLVAGEFRGMKRL